MMVADALVPSWRQVISNHHVDTLLLNYFDRGSLGAQDDGGFFVGDRFFAW